MFIDKLPQLYSRAETHDDSFSGACYGVTDYKTTYTSEVNSPADMCSSYIIIS